MAGKGKGKRSKRATPPHQWTSYDSFFALITMLANNFDDIDVITMLFVARTFLQCLSFQVNNFDDQPAARTRAISSPIAVPQPVISGETR